MHRKKTNRCTGVDQLACDSQPFYRMTNFLSSQ